MDSTSKSPMQKGRRLEARSYRPLVVKLNRWHVLALFTLAGLLALLTCGSYWWGWTWTGIGPFVHTGKANGQDYQRGKTLWDLIQLLILPVVVATAAALFSWKQKEYELERTRELKKYELELSENGRMDAALENYLGKMSDLLMEKYLGDSAPGDRVRAVARAWTLTVLEKVEDSERKRRVVRFLAESKVIQGIEKDGKTDNIIPLGNANLVRARLEGFGLEGVYLRWSHLEGANLKRTRLQGADLAHVHLEGAMLQKADLRGANLTEANLNGANFKGADLSGARLKGADLAAADLKGARLTDGRVTQLYEVRSLDGALLPDGTKVTTLDAWMRSTQADLAEGAEKPRQEVPV